MPFLKPGLRKVKREKKLKPKAVKCCYLGRAPNFPRDALCVLLKSGIIIVTRNVTWAHAPKPRFPPMPTPVPDGVKSFQGGGVKENSDEQAPSAEDNVESSGESDSDDGVVYDRIAAGHDPRRREETRQTEEPGGGKPKRQGFKCATFAARCQECRRWNVTIISCWKRGGHCRKPGGRICVSLSTHVR